MEPARNRVDIAVLVASLAPITARVPVGAVWFVTNHPKKGNIMLGLLLTLIYLAVVVFVIAGMWKTFVKAGKPGWACLIPIYNLYVLTQIAGKPAWFIVLFLIPLVNIYAIVVTFHGVSTGFGKGVGFTLGLIFLGFIFWPLLGFGDAQYSGATA